MIRAQLRAARGAAAVLAFSAISVILAACATAPVKEIGAYNSAFTQARLAGVEIYEELLPAYVAAGGETGAPAPEAASDATLSETLGKLVSAGPGATPPSAPRRFTGSLGEGFRNVASGCSQFASYPSLIARCHALALAARYNEAIVKLTDDSTKAAAESELNSILGLVGPLSAMAGTFTGPLTSIAIESFTALIGDALAAGDATEMLEILNAGLPKVERLIQLLKQDVPLIYEARRVYDEGRLTLLAAELQNADADFRGNYSITRRPPESASALTALYAKHQERYRTAFGRVLGNPEVGAEAAIDRMEKTDPGHGIPYSERQSAAIGGNIAAIEAVTARFETVEAEWRAFEKALEQYELMLGSLGEATRALAAAARPRPVVDPVAIFSFVAAPLSLIGVPGLDGGGGDGAELGDILNQIFLHADLIQQLLP